MIYDRFFILFDHFFRVMQMHVERFYTLLVYVWKRLINDCLLKEGLVRHLKFSYLKKSYALKFPF